MTVKDLKEMIQDMPDNMEVIVPLNPTNGFDGAFFSPCMEESQIIEMGVNEEDLDKTEVEELISPSETIPSFVLVPCGFFQEHEGVKPQLN